MSHSFKNSFGLDLSDKQIEKCEEKLKSSSDKISLINDEYYNLLNYIENKLIKFDLITIGQAFTGLKTSSSLILQEK